MRLTLFFQMMSCQCSPPAPRTSLLQLTPSLPYAVVWWTIPTASDNVGIASISSDYNPGDNFCVHSRLVTYNATDLAGNLAQCTFWVNVTGELLTSIGGCNINLCNQLLFSNQMQNWNSANHKSCFIISLM